MSFYLPYNKVLDKWPQEPPMQWSVNLESNLWCPQFSQKNYRNSLPWASSLLSIVFGRIEKNIICFRDCLTFRTLLLVCLERDDIKKHVLSVTHLADCKNYLLQCSYKNFGTYNRLVHLYLSIETVQLFW